MTAAIVHDHNPTYYGRAPRCCPVAPETNRVYRKRIREERHHVARMSPVGASRRLQGLVANGHPIAALARELGTNERSIYRWMGGHARIHRTRHNAIVALASALAEVPGTSRRARTIAHRHGWVPLAAWDDIDDPNETPKTRSAAHVRDGRVLIGRVLAGVASIDVLTVGEQHRLWQRWADERRHQKLPCGSTSFARHFGISEIRARRIIAAAQQTPTTAADSRTNRKVA